MSAISPRGRIEIAARHVATLATEQERFAYLLGVYQKMESDLTDHAHLAANLRVADRLTGIIDKLHRQFGGVMDETRGRIRELKEWARCAPPPLNARGIDSRREPIETPQAAQPEGPEPDGEAGAPKGA